jgi:uncharacterized cupin superfamily protein
MRWLLTTKATLSLSQLDEKLAYWECTREGMPLPLDNQEQVIMVEGPADLEMKVKKDNAIIAINPDSEMGLFGG